MRKLLAYCAVFIAITVMLAGCSGEKAPVVDTATAAPTAAPAVTTAAAATPAPTAEVPVPRTAWPEPVTLTWYLGSLGNAIIQSYSENPMFQEIQEKLNINIEFQHSAQGQFADQLGVMIASRDLPDMIGGFSYNKGPEAAVNDGLILRLNELAEEYAPDYLAVLNSDPEIWRQIVTDEGTIWGATCIQPEAGPAWRGLSIRQDLLDQLGLPMPETMGELEETCLKFKEIGVTYPISIAIRNGTAYSGDSIFVSSFGVGANWYVDLDTKDVEYGPLQDEFLDFLTLMNKWYGLGILDVDFNTRTGEDLNKMLVTGEIAIHVNGYGPTLVNQNNGNANNPDFQLELFPFLPLVKGDVVHARNTDTINKGSTSVISTNCENPEAAMFFLNYGYTEEGFMHYNYGVEGLSYEMINGEPQFTPLIVNGEEGAWVNIREKYKMHTGPYLRDWGAFPVTDFEMRCMDIWTRNENDMMLSSFLTRTATENEVFTPTMTNINTYIDEALTAFINGSKPLTEFDGFRDTIKSMGIEEALEIQRASYQRYLNR